MQGLIQCDLCHAIIGGGKLYLSRGKAMIQLSKENRFYNEGYRHGIVQHNLPAGNVSSFKFYTLIFSKDGNKEEIRDASEDNDYERNYRQPSGLHT